VAIFSDTEAGKAYIANPGGTVLRVTPKTAVADAPFDTPPLRPHGTNQTEAGLATSLAALERALMAKRDAGTTTDLGIAVRTPNKLGQYGTYCIEQGVNCNGDNRDTIYPTSNEFFLTAATKVVIFGVNHAAAGKASYSSFSIYDAKRLMGVAAVNSHQMVGSAAAYLPGDPNASKLYAWTIARNCGTDTYCTAIADACPGIARTDPAFIAVRAYLEPATKTSPDPSELLLDKAILFP
jgi:hypothetical protein